MNAACHPSFASVVQVNIIASNDTVGELVSTFVFYLHWDCLSVIHVYTMTWYWFTFFSFYIVGRFAFFHILIPVLRTLERSSIHWILFIFHIFDAVVHCWWSSVFDIILTYIVFGPYMIKSRYLLLSTLNSRVISLLLVCFKSSIKDMFIIHQNCQSKTVWVSMVKNNRYTTSPFCVIQMIIQALCWRNRKFKFKIPNFESGLDRTKDLNLQIQKCKLAITRNTNCKTNTHRS